MKFRDWLVSRLADTRFAGWTYEPERLGRVSDQLGVQPSVLRDACEIRQQRRRETGRPLVRKGFGGASREYPQIEVNMPGAVWHAWRDACAQAGVLPSAMLRSIVHVYLQGDWEPEHISRHWVFKGRAFEVRDRRFHRETGKKWPYRERAVITRGANIALMRRAELQRASRHALLRGLVLEVVNGRLTRLVPIDATNMWDDAERYLRRPEGGGDETQGVR